MAVAPPKDHRPSGAFSELRPPPGKGGPAVSDTRRRRSTSATIWLFRLPSGQIVAAVSVDARCDLTDVVDLLEDCYFGDVLIEGRKIEEHARTLAAQLGADGSTEPGLLPERHQIVFDQAPYPTTTRICRSGWSTGPISPTARTTARSATPPSSTAAPAGWQRSART